MYLFPFQVKAILNQVDPSGGDVQVLCKEEGSRIWLDWVVPNLRIKAAETLKSYLTSLQKFMEFLTKRGEWPHLPAIRPEDRETLSDLASGLKVWRRFIMKETSSDRYEKILEESDQILTNQEVEAIMSSRPAIDRRLALGQAEVAKSPETLTLQQYAAARDLLVVSLTWAVGT